MKVSKAVIPAAGLGTRLLPATKAQPKEMLPIVDKPTMQYIIEEAVASGIKDILIITGRNKSAIENHFDKSLELEMELKERGQKTLLQTVEKISNLANIHYIRQKEPLGLGHAIGCAKTFVGHEPFAVLLGDDIVDYKIPCLKHLIECYEDYQSTILGVQKVLPHLVSKYGIIDAEPIHQGIYRVKDLVEKPALNQAPSTIAILGRYILSPRIFEVIPKIQPGRGGEIQLTDALKKLLEHEKVYACRFQGKRYDVGDKWGFLEANLDFAMKEPYLKKRLLKKISQIILEHETLQN